MCSLHHVFCMKWSQPLSKSWYTWFTWDSAYSVGHTLCFWNSICFSPQIPYSSKEKLHRTGLTNWHGTVLFTLLSCWNLPITLAQGVDVREVVSQPVYQTHLHFFNPSWETSFSNISFNNPDFSYKYYIFFTQMDSFKCIKPIFLF